MSSSDRVTDALEIFFTQLAETLAWRGDLMKEQTRAGERQARLLRALRAGIGTLPEPDQRIALERLDRLAGREARTPTDGGTDRTRLANEWIRYEAPPEFRAADLRDHLARCGHRTTTHYAGTLLCRLAKRGEVVRCGQGAYQVRRA